MTSKINLKLKKASLSKSRVAITFWVDQWFKGVID